ncbi:MAG: hypothetical protein K2W82_16110 [Candidatus Obscuribacterales bacterium]|nr:hypothetical protein [Candidatus Obscuribacterales bacterium]
MKSLLAKCFAGTALLAAYVGFVDATYLTVSQYLNGTPPCSFALGCETVLTSVYAQVLGIPVSLIGAVYYVALVLLVLAHLDRGSRRVLAFAGALSVSGLFASLWFIYLQAFVLTSYCAYCLVSAASTALTCAFIGLAWHMQRDLEARFTSLNLRAALAQPQK